MPLDTRSSDTVCWSPSEVIGSTVTPCAPIRNGYSFVPCRVPRYLSTRRRRVDVCSVTRWSRTITQSETYSSMPWRVSAPSPRSPVITAVTPRSLSQPNSRRSSARKMLTSSKAPNSVSIVSSTTRLAPTSSMAAPMRMNRPSRSQEPASCRSLGARFTWSITSRPSFCSCCRSNPMDATFSTSSCTFSSNEMKTPGSPNSVIPRNRNSIASSVLPHPAGPHTSVGRPCGSPPPVTSSSPLMPVAALRRAASFGARCGGRLNVWSAVLDGIARLPQISRTECGRTNTLSNVTAGRGFAVPSLARQRRRD
jgi:hypothetical protein